MRFLRILAIFIIVLTFQACGVSEPEVLKDPVVEYQQIGAPIDVYLVPMSDFPESVSADFAKRLSTELKVVVKSSLRLGELKVSFLPGTEQLLSHDILEKSQPVLRSLPGASEGTYFLILTTADINSSDGFRFQFSTHSKELNTSVVSSARMDYFDFIYRNDVTKKRAQRLYKMTKRAIGELHLGWKRSVNIKDIMYSPIMGLPDIDRIGTEHIEDLAE